MIPIIYDLAEAARILGFSESYLRSKLRDRTFGRAGAARPRGDSALPPPSACYRLHPVINARLQHLVDRTALRKRREPAQ